jgi:hypothetical protein
VLALTCPYAPFKVCICRAVHGHHRESEQSRETHKQRQTSTGWTNTEVNALHPSNAYPDTLASDSGIVTLSNELHPSNAAVPMEVTECGMVTLINELHPLKTILGIDVIDSGIKTPTPMEPTELGIVTVVNERHPLNALPLMATMAVWINTLACSVVATR